MRDVSKERCLLAAKGCGMLYSQQFFMRRGMKM